MEHPVSRRAVCPHKAGLDVKSRFQLDSGLKPITKRSRPRPRRAQNIRPDPRGKEISGNTVPPALNLGYMGEEGHPSTAEQGKSSRKGNTIMGKEPSQAGPNRDAANREPGRWTGMKLNGCLALSVREACR